MAFETFGRKARIAGRVSDAQTGKPLAGAQVAITNGPQAVTAADGFFRFLDLPAGSYTLTASLPGKGSRWGTASKPVALGGALAKVDLALPATTVKGKVKDPSGQAVRMAEVRVQGSNESAWSDAQGNYVL